MYSSSKLERRRRMQDVHSTLGDHDWSDLLSDNCNRAACVSLRETRTSRRHITLPDCSCELLSVRHESFQAGDEVMVWQRGRHERASLAVLERSKPR